MTYVMVSNVSDGTDLNATNRRLGTFTQYETGETVEVLWNVTSPSSYLCESVALNGQSCTTCSICNFTAVANSSSIVIESLKISSDCTNLPNGRNAICEDYKPVFYPLLVRNFDTMCANNGGREFLTRYFLFVCSFRPTIRIPHRRLIPSFCAATLQTLLVCVRTVRWLNRFLFVPGPIVLSLELTIFPM
jgi:hypothetical protein